MQWKKKRQQKNPSNFEAEKMAMIYSVFYLSLSGLEKYMICHFVKLSHYPQLDAHINEYNESLHFTTTTLARLKRVVDGSKF